MAAGKVFALSIALGAVLSGSFGQAMNKAATLMRRLGDEEKFVQKEQKRLKTLFEEGKINLNGYREHLKRLSDELKNNRLQQEKLQKAGAAKQQAVPAIGKASAKFAGIAAVASAAYGFAQPAMEFQAMMSKVKAITNSTDADMAKLTAQARELGATTQFTARQSAEAMTFLGMAGWKTNEIMKGMPGLLSLAAAGGTDLARTADIISDDLTAFGLSADKAAHMADVFAVTITNTNTNVEMLGETMKYAAPVAHGFGISLEDTAALAGLMANGSIKASQAGTSLRAGLLRLVSPPKKASKALDEMGVNLQCVYTEQREAQAGLAALGIEMTDFNGKNRKMSAILTDLRNKTEGLAREEKLAALNAIFGTNASSGWLNVIEAGPEQFDALVKKLENCDGAAANVAKTMNDNAKGAITQMESAVESLQITLGNHFLPIIGESAKKVADMAQIATKWADENPELVRTIFEVGGAITAWYAATTLISTGATLVKAAHGAWVLYSAGVKGATWMQTAFNIAASLNPIGLVVAAIVAACYAFYQYCGSMEEVKRKFNIMCDTLEMHFKNTINNFIELWNFFLGKITGTKFEKIKVPVVYSAAGDADSYQVNYNDDAIKAQTIAANASGGIYAKGAFLTTFAEDSGESAIPHTRTAHNIGLLQRTNEIMGNPLSGGDTINATFSPVINISGNADAAAVSMAIDDGFEKFKRYMAQFQREQRRVSYA